jgi:hypothetical protein
MGKERHPPSRPPPEAAPRREREIGLGAFARRFVNRADWYALQQRDGSYVAVNRPLTLGLIQRHLAGELTLGVYALDAQSRALWVCFDADDRDGWAAVRGLHERLRTQAVPSYLEQSRRGGHLWLFFAEPLAGRTVRVLARSLLDERVEIFPKQDRVAPGRPGSLVRLPLGIHRRDMQRYAVAFRGSEAHVPSLAEQLQHLANVQTVPSAVVAAVLAEHVATKRHPLPHRRVERPVPAASLIGRIKAELDLYELVARHVELTPSGRGHCPFHEDAHMSFSVNRAGGYFNCFADCGGGDVIAFWERYRRIGTRQAVRELAGLLPGGR